MFFRIFDSQRKLEKQKQVRETVLKHSSVIFNIKKIIENTEIEPKKSIFMVLQL